jgi:hypothetical protein
VFKFSSGDGAPKPVEFDGKIYQLPRFLRPQQKEWADAFYAQELDKVTKGMTPMKRAQYIALTPPQQFTSRQINKALLGPDGIDFVVRWSLEKAGAPSDVIECILTNGDPLILEDLVESLTASASVDAILHRDSQETDTTKGEGTDFLPSTSGSTTATSTTSPEIGQPTTPSSEQPTPEPTPTA